jgi:hypothetical protein
MKSSAKVDNFSIEKNSKLKTYNSENIRICNIKGCSNLHKSKGLCNTHYARFRRNGNFKKHEFQKKHQLSFSVEYQIWLGIKKRCYNSNHKDFDIYGGRGIIMSNEFKNNFKSFYDYIGKRPTKQHSIDRIDSNGNYERGNIRWATNYVQCINQRIRKDNTSGYKGVMLNKHNSWIAFISVNKKKIYLGSFKDINDALSARKKAEKKYQQPYLDLMK